MFDIRPGSSGTHRVGQGVSPSLDPTHLLVKNCLLKLARAAGQVHEFGEVQDGRAIKLVNSLVATLNECAQDLDTLAASSGGFTSAAIAKRLAPFLRHPHWDGAEVQTRPLRTEVRRLYQDLDYLDTFQHGGLAALNQRLALALESLQSADSSTSNAGAIVLNDLLTRAIHLFPHHARSIEVLLKPNNDTLQRDLERTLGTDAIRRTSFLQWLEMFRALCRNDRAPARFPLPYVFAADDERGKKIASQSSWQEVAFFPHRQVARRDVVGAGMTANSGAACTSLPPTLRVLSGYRCAQRSLDHALYSLFQINEIERIVFSGADLFLPWQGETGDQKVAPKPNFVYHYLIFRDFGDIGKNPGLASRSGIAQIANHSIFAPSFSSSLLDIAEDDSSQWLEQDFGYLALPHLDPQECQLIQFAGILRQNLVCAPIGALSGCF